MGPMGSRSRGRTYACIVRKATVEALWENLRLMPKIICVNLRLKLKRPPA
jgi:hypothetical protein